MRPKANINIGDRYGRLTIVREVEKRGIYVCQEWQRYLNFHNWAIQNGYSANLTIDRIDVNGNYEPSNCRWITIQEQQKNKRK